MIMLKIGMVGMGGISKSHRAAWKQIEEAQVVCVCDIRPEMADAAAEDTGAKAYYDFDEMLAAEKFDILDICLPTYLHADFALMAMDKVKYLFIEKPVALTVAESEALLAKQQKTGCQVQIGQVIRFWDEYVALRQIVASGKYGKVVNANFRRISPSPDWGWNDWLLNPALSGGAAQDLHIHDIDYVLSLFGEPRKIYSVKNVLGEGNSYVSSLLQYPEHVVSVEGTWYLPGCHPFQATFRVVFEKAVVENDGGKFMLYTTAGAEEIKLDKKEMVSTGGTQGNISDLGGYYNELKYFVGQAAKGAAIEEATLSSAAASLKFLLEKELNI